MDQSQMDQRLADWMAGYRSAWESNDPDDIRALFTEDAEYYTEPFAEPWRGHDEIVKGWLEARDEPGDTSFEWVPLVVTPELAVVQATTVYIAERTYSNLWVIRFAPDGRAREFTEWWMKQPD
ncbi:MAG TPA: nuclear transport factor 2 family protein [Microbacteriaceae bacterium]|jgi:SnoaL-like polyketide cyclase.